MGMTTSRQQVLDKVNEMMDVSYGCAESFVAAVGEYLWGGVDDHVQMISTGFSGGVGGTNEELCGGVSGAVMLISMLYGRTEVDEGKMIRCKRLVSKHRDRFIEHFGSTKCQELRDAQFGADERNPCSAIIAPAADMLIELLEEEQARLELVQRDAETRPHGIVIPYDEYTANLAGADAHELLAEIGRWELPHKYRLWLGERLDQLGDIRPGVGIGQDGLPDIVWLPVEGGQVEVERAGRFSAGPFYMSKYPLTAQQFQVFLDDLEGFNNDAWWQGMGLPEAHRKAPGEQRFLGDNRPRDNVSWFDAAAFCRWLIYRMRNTRLQGDDSYIQVLEKIQRDGWEVRLPTEWEWQLAAADSREEYLFPWGIDWEDLRAHTKHNQLNQSMPVGMYLDGESLYGVLDMSGNIWEWCLNAYERPGEIRYTGMDRRVLRGGSWYHWGSYAHVHMRLRYPPNYRWNAGGMRLVCAEPLE